MKTYIFSSTLRNVNADAYTICCVHWHVALFTSMDQEEC